MYSQKKQSHAFFMEVHKGRRKAQQGPCHEPIRSKQVKSFQFQLRLASRH
jgi:hypothetical protein